MSAAEKLGAAGALLAAAALAVVAFGAFAVVDTGAPCPLLCYHEIYPALAAAPLALAAALVLAGWAVRARSR